MKNGKQLLGKDLIFISRINGSGRGTEPVDDDMSYEDDSKFTLQSLSVTNGTYIASENVSYVVKIKPYAQLSDTPKYKLWKHLVDEHDLTLLETDLGLIIRLANECKND